MKRLLLAAALALGALALAAGCYSTPPQPQPWKGRIDVYGTMHAVMLEGKTEGRVELAPLQADARLVGIGALEGLAGEVVLLDGVAWCTRSGELGTLETHAGAEKGAKATLLATARVSQWFALPVAAELPFSGIEAFVAQAAREHGLAHTETFPFLIEGSFHDVRAHVLHGSCPYMGKSPPGTEPVRRVLPLAKGRLVGFYTELAPGTLTHMGEKTHVHLLVKEGESIVAHVDELRIDAGAVLKLPLVE
jgi:alpha-acetolactate decarboxylase